MKQEILNDHVIYGDWDSDGGSEQFLVFYHPNGRNCHVFLLTGSDYGGGIYDHFDALSEDVDRIVSQEDKNDFDIIKEIQNLKSKEN